MAATRLIGLEKVRMPKLGWCGTLGTYVIAKAAILDQKGLKPTSLVIKDQSSEYRNIDQRIHYNP